MTPNFDYKEGRGDYYRGEGIREERERVTPQPDTRHPALQALEEIVARTEGPNAFIDEQRDIVEAALERAAQAEALLGQYREAVLSEGRGLFVFDPLSAGDSQ